jgi:uncharacterized membrane protein YgdD (TMEM256/DUF423 family)
MGLERRLLILASVNGALAVVLGAFGAHGLRTFLAALPDSAERRSFWETASHYHLAHALALAFAGYLASRDGTGPWAAISGYAFAVGILLFSGSLYAMTLTGVRVLGAITPLGGLGFILGWVAAGVAAARIR